MPSYVCGFTKEDLVFVKANEGSIWYGFKAKDFSSVPGVTTANIEALGWLHTNNMIPSGGIRVIGANSPKPQRVKLTLKKRPGVNEQGTISTFVSYDSINTAMAGKWELVGSPPRVTLANSARTKTVGAKIDANGALYLFPMNASDAASFAATLGLSLPTQITEVDRKKAFKGATRPRPAVMGKIINASTGAKFSTFVSYDKEDDAIVAGFEYVTGAVILPDGNIGGGGTPP